LTSCSFTSGLDRNAPTIKYTKAFKTIQNLSTYSKATSASKTKSKSIPRKGTKNAKISSIQSKPRNRLGSTRVILKNTSSCFQVIKSFISLCGARQYTTPIFHYLTPHIFQMKISTRIQIIIR
jgi:hypothetical protein